MERREFLKAGAAGAVSAVALSRGWTRQVAAAAPGQPALSDVLLSGVFAPGDGPTKYVSGLDTDQFAAATQSFFDDQGLRLAHMTAWTDAPDSVRWAAAYHSGDWSQDLRVGLRWPDLHTETDALKAQGWRLERIAPWSTDDGDALWAALYRPGDRPVALRSGYPSTTSFLQIAQRLFDDAGLRPAQVVRHQMNDELAWAGVFRATDDAGGLEVRNSMAAFEARAADLAGHRLHTVGMTSWSEGGQRRVCGVCSDAAETVLVLDQGPPAFESTVQDLASQGLRLVSIDAYKE